jgi:hypothetical protein
VYQAKYMNDLMKKFNMAELKPVSTPMSSAASLGPDEDGEAPSCTSQRHGQTFSSSWGCAQAFSLSHAFHIGRQFSEFLGISNTLLTL